MRRRFAILTGIAMTLAIPLVTRAEIDTITKLFESIRDVLDLLIPFIVGLGVFVILWGIFGYISHSAEEEKRAEARLFIIYGVLGVFFMLSLWGFVNILTNTFMLRKEVPTIRPNLPSIPGA